jgi:hypothetical protein
MHPKRDTIDHELLFGRVNLSELGRTHAVSRDALRAHQNRHLEDLRAEYRACGHGLTLAQLRGDAKRLYLISLDALAAAQRGVVVGTDSEGRPVRRVRQADVARMLREARQTLDLVIRLNDVSSSPPRGAQTRRNVSAPPSAPRGSSRR